jgi:PAS domain S-box-containing protein
MRCLAQNKRSVIEYTAYNRVYQVVMAPIRSAGYVNLYFSDITARKQSERALAESEARFRALAHHAPVGIFMTRRDGNVTYLNRKWLQLAGRTVEQSLGKGWLKAVHPQDRRRITDQWRRAVSKGNSTSSEFRFQHPDGQVTWAHAQATRLRSATGQEEGYIGTAVDITGRKRAEEALRHANEQLEKRVRQRTRALTRLNAGLQKEVTARRRIELALRENAQRLRLMIEGTHDYAIFMLDPKGRVATWNSGAEEIKGYRAKEIIGKHFSRFYAAEDVRHNKPDLLLQAARHSGRAEDEGWRVHQDGRPYYASVILSALRDERGRLRGFLNVTRDITEQRRMSEVLEQSRESLENFFENSPLGLFWIGPNGTVQRVNKAGLELLGCRREDCLHRPIANYWADERLAALALVQLRRGQPLQNHRARLKAKDGTLRHVLIDANAWREGGRLLHTRWFVRDISRRVELEREILAVAEGERQRIGRDLHDDLCQQLTGLEFLSQTLAGRLRHAAADADMNERAQEICRTIRTAINYARDLSHGLAPSLLESAGLETALEELTERTRKFYGVDCRFRAKKSGARANQATDIHLYRIAQEAVGNAIKHGHARRIDIGLTQTDKDVVLAIKDFGVGMPEELPNRRGIGLRMMQYRAGVIGGTLLIQRNSRGGTTVVCTVHEGKAKANQHNGDQSPGKRPGLVADSD